jgi:dTDP-4-dehydrorhamnose reductase
MMIIDILSIIGMPGMKKISKNNIKILVLGANGMLGSMVYFYFKNYTSYNVSGTFNKNKIYSKFKKFNALSFIQGDKNHTILVKNYDYIINCIGLIKPDTINNTEQAILINSLFPHYLSKQVSPMTKIIQINTDCVYSGNQNKSYNENSLHDALDTYGKTKSLGEVLEKNFINIRTSIIGPEPTKFHKSLFEWFKNEKGKINGFTNHIWNGVSTYAFSRIVEFIINKKLFHINQFNISFVKRTNKFTLLEKLNKFLLNDTKKINKHNSPFKINRSLTSNYKELNSVISKALYGKNEINITEMLKEWHKIQADFYKFYNK